MMRHFYNLGWHNDSLHSATYVTDASPSSNHWNRWQLQYGLLSRRCTIDMRPTQPSHGPAAFDLPTSNAISADSGPKCLAHVVPDLRQSQTPNSSKGKAKHFPHLWRFFILSTRTPVTILCTAIPSHRRL